MYEKILIHSPKLNIKAVEELERLGFECRSTKPCDYFSPQVDLHADMQYFRLGKKLYCIGSAELCPPWLKAEKIGLSYDEKPYRNEAKLNLFRIGSYVLGNQRLCYKFSLPDNLTFIHCNQGYAACSCLRVGDNAVITDDVSISLTLKTLGFDVLIIEKGDILLEGYPYGFIGGASAALSSELVCFFGSLDKLGQGDKIKEFLLKHRVKYIELFDSPLVDIGGAVILKEENT
ncbi:MAG: hypothetical protein E7646_07385 [Ruminococcaceae bacterium]|nr:hypothetical protein [Oscillospiraceae bacterium]